MISLVTADGGNNPAALTQAWFDAVKRAGHQGFATQGNRWQSTDYWPDSGVFLDRALTAGLFVAIYARYPEAWESVLNGLGPDLAAKLRCFCLDVEPETTGKHPVYPQHVDGLVLRDQRPIIYSNAGMWADVMANPDSVEFATVALWDRAIRAKQPTGMGQQPLWPFAGWNLKWTRRKIWQWADGTLLAGVPVTLNVVDGRWI